jgi:hypothetical protein
MDQPTIPLPFPNASTDPIDRDLTDIDAAITLVASGLATRVRLVGLVRPEATAPAGLAHAQEAKVGFSLDRNADGIAAVTLGPRGQSGHRS